jgi:voltage-gated potassium channel
MKSISHPRNNFVYLLVGLLLLFVLPPYFRLFVAERVEIDTQRALLLMAFSLFGIVSVWSLYQNRWIFLLGFALALLNIVSGAAQFLHSQVTQIWAFEMITFLSMILFSVLSCFIAGRHVFNWRETDANSLVGAVCVYMLMGLIFAMIYNMFAYFWPNGAFQGLAFDRQTVQFDNFLYFSFVTLTTAGYGDITPVNPFLRTLTYLEMISGQFYMAILVSALVAHFMGARMSRQPVD